jgi:amidohydrolase
MDLHAIAKEYEPYLIEMRRWFHQHPEIAEKEFETSARIKAELDKYGISWRPCGLQTGVLATIVGEKPGKTILLRGDMDALPVTEETGAPYASQNPGFMHACGHDCHTATMLTVARLLNDNKDKLCGTVKVAFQPAEEVGTGAPGMINEGALEGVDSAFAIHIMSMIPSGQVSLNCGPQMAGVDKFVIKIEGKGGHASSPHECIDPVVCMGAMIGNLQTVVSRQCSPMDSAVLTIGKVESGTLWNIIPDTATLSGTTRYFTRQLYWEFPEMMERVVTSTAETYRCKAKLDYIRMIPPTINDISFAELVRTSAGKVVSNRNVVNIGPIAIGEDFGLFLEKVPGALALVGVGNESCGAVWPQHSAKYTVDEDALMDSVMLYVQVALDHNAQ